MRNADHIFKRIEESEKEFLKRNYILPNAVSLDTNDFEDLDRPTVARGLRVIESESLESGTVFLL